MSPPPIQTPNLPLDPATLHALLRSTIDAVPQDPAASAEDLAALRDAAFIVVDALRPRDPFEALLAARCVVAHYQLMDNFRCATQRSLPPNLVLRYQGRAIALSRLMDGTMQELKRRQATPALQPHPAAAQAQAAAPQPATPQPGPATTPPAATTAQPNAPKPAPSPTPPVATAPTPRPVARPHASTPTTPITQNAMHQAILDEIAARAATAIPALAA